MSFVFRHRLVRLQNPQACVSDLRLLTQFSMICQGTRSVNVLANGDYMRFDRFCQESSDNLILRKSINSKYLVHELVVYCSINRYATALTDPIFASYSLTDSLRTLTNSLILGFSHARASASPPKVFFTRMGFGPAPIAWTLLPQNG